MHRHQLVRLTDAGWARACEGARDDAARRSLELWAERSFPLVVTRQRERAAVNIAVGLPAPACFERRRLALGVETGQIRRFEEFPVAGAATPLLSDEARPAWAALLHALAELGCAARVYGSHGWQCLTGLAYLHETSDIDLLLPVVGSRQADEVCTALARSRVASPRLDGELVFADGAAVAWREWQRFRAGATDGVLVKRLRGVAIERWSGETAPC